MNKDRFAHMFDLLCARFPPLSRASSKLEVRSLRKYLRVRALVLLYSAVIPSPSLARLQPQLTAAFRFFTEAHGSSEPGRIARRDLRLKIILPEMNDHLKRHLPA
jgi:hypothetical protein